MSTSRDLDLAREWWIRNGKTIWDEDEDVFYRSLAGLLASVRAEGRDAGLEEVIEVVDGVYGSACSDFIRSLKSTT